MKPGTADNTGRNEIRVAHITQNSHPSIDVSVMSKNHVDNTRMQAASKEKDLYNSTN